VSAGGHLATGDAHTPSDVAHLATRDAHLASRHRHHDAARPTTLELRTTLSVVDVLAVANTRHGPAGHWHARPTADSPDHDHLASPTEAVRWLVEHGVRIPAGQPTADQLRTLAAIRELVRGLADEPSSELGIEVQERLDRAAYRVTRAGGIDAVAQGWDGFADDLLLPTLEILAQAALVSRCANPLCRFTFLDGSRNRSRRWCDPMGCGNRIRVRRSRARSQAGSCPPPRRPG
jgi:hypothetical protein